MKQVIAFMIISLSVCSCSHRIVRIGYQLTPSEYKDCDLPIKSDVKVDSNFRKIGEIRLGDCKNSRIKSEEQVFTIIRKEGCSIGAELAIIEPTDTTNVKNTCYKYRASYYSESQQRIKNAYQVDKNKTSSDNNKRALEIGIAMLTIFTICAIIIRY